MTTLLGKRGRPTGVWTPGSGLEHKTTEDERILFDKRTSLLFLQLQQDVKDALRWRHTRDAKARNESAEIAQRCPLVFAEEPASTHTKDEVEEAPTPVKRVSILSFEEKMKADALAAKARAEAAKALPAPLTQVALDEAYKQLPAGADQTIESVINCWRNNKLSADDVLSTVKSFSGSSVVLQEMFFTSSSVDGEGEVASDEQMRELARLAMCC